MPPSAEQLVLGVLVGFHTDPPASNGESVVLYLDPPGSAHSDPRFPHMIFPFRANGSVVLDLDPSQVHPVTRGFGVLIHRTGLGSVTDPPASNGGSVVQDMDPPGIRPTTMAFGRFPVLLM